MRKKYNNAASQPSLKQLFMGFQETEPKEIQSQRSQTPLNRYAASEQQAYMFKYPKIAKDNEKAQPYSQNLENNRRIGTEMDRMEDEITSIYSKRKNQKQLKKSNNNLDYSTVSIANNSALRLPSINTPPSFSNCNEQSKLVEQIRRVQNKIKELRFQRNLASTQQDKFEMMRPFIELQNQNMMNMQYMMMMAQQNRAHQSHCCSRSVPANQTRVVYVPCPQFNPINPIPPQYSNIHQLTPDNHYSPSSPMNQENLPKRSMNKSQTSKKTYDFKKIRKFRVAVIAVYFYLLFPKFVNLFTKRRFEIHSQKYFGTQQPHHSKIIAKAFDNLSDIDYYQLAKTVESHRKQKQIRRVTKAKTAKLVISEQYGQVKDYQIYLGDLEVFLLMLLKKIHEIIENGAFDDLINQLSVGNLPFSFPIDHSYIQEQLYRIKFHPHKTYILCDQLQSKALLMATFFIKLLAYDFLFVIRQDMEWKHQFLKKNNLKKSQMIEAEMVSTQMYISGILLHRYCMDILREQIKQLEGNVDKIQQKNVPIPMGMMIYQSKDQVNNDNQLKKNSYKASQNRQLKQNSRKRFNESGQEYHLDQFSYIKKLAQFDNLMSEIIEKSGHNEEVKEKISDIIDQIYKKSVKNRELQYRQITSTVLSENKNILKKKLGNEKNSFELPKRTNEEKDQVKQLLKQIKESKKKDNQIYTEESLKKTSKKLTMKNIKFVQNKRDNKSK